ncbi:MAG TPA: Gfo/Idh/MocA family oxidoreductase [Bryobacteraceae bacterium]|nr:Gfo/Idh/MocA family oxidoreductase [Bryobacteraceae bacterium]
MIQYAVKMRNYRVGVIGRTGRGNYGHRLDMVWKTLPNTKVVAVSDDDPAGLKEAVNRLGVFAAYPDFRDMLRRERLDLVAIATRWPESHLEMVRAATEARVAGIYMDKPIARTPAEADEILALCERSGTKLSVAHQMRISPLIELARERVAQGAIGQLLELRGRGKEDARAGGDDLMILGTHIFDLMRQFAGDPQWCFGRVTAGGREITRADARPGLDGLGTVAGDTVAAAYGFSGGITGYFASMRSGDTSGRRWGLDLYGSQGILSIRADMANPVVRIAESSEWAGAAWSPLQLPAAAPRTPDDANRALVADLLDAIEHNREPRAGGRAALWAVEMALAVYHSQLSGTRVAFPLARRGNPLTA